MRSTGIVFLGTGLLVCAIAKGASLVEAEELESSQTKTVGCAANTVYVILRCLCPELDVRFSEVAAVLPLERACSGKEILDCLRAYPVKARALRVLPHEAIPAQGGFSIVLLRRENAQGHWYGVARPTEDSVILFGKKTLYEVKGYTLAHVNRVLGERAAIRRAGSKADNDETDIVIMVSRDSGSSRVHWTLSILAAIALTSGYIIVLIVLRGIASRTRLALLVIPLVLFVQSCGTDTASGPILHVVDPHRDLGIVVLPVTAEGHLVSQVFQLRNVGTAPLVINRITQSCTCTDAEVSGNTILPGEEVSLALQVSLEQGRTRTVTAMIESNDTGPSSSSLVSVSYAALALWKVEPQSLIFHSPEWQLKTQSRTVHIFVAERASSAFRFDKVVVPQELVSVEPGQISVQDLPRLRGSEEKDAYRVYDFTISDRGNLRAGTYTGIIEYLFSEGLHIQQSVTINVPAAVELIPHELTFIQDQNGSAPKRLRLVVHPDVRKSGNPPVSICGIICEQFSIDFRQAHVSEVEILAEISVAQETQGFPSEATLVISLEGVKDEFKEALLPIQVL